MAVVLAAESRGLLIGERAEPELVDQIRALALADPGVSSVREVRTMHVGPRQLTLLGDDDSDDGDGDGGA